MLNLDGYDENEIAKAITENSTDFSKICKLMIDNDSSFNSSDFLMNIDDEVIVDYLINEYDDLELLFDYIYDRAEDK